MNKTKLAYQYNGDNYEYLNEIEAHYDPLESVKMGSDIFALPLNATFVAPLEPKTGFVNVFNKITATWSLIDDFRGQIFYYKMDGTAVEVEQIGKVSDTLTDKPYPGRFYKWAGTDWVLDEAEKANAIITANKAEKSRRFNDAVAMIKMYEEAEVDGDILPDELELLKAWRAYQRKINRITDLSTEGIEWAVRPE